MRRVFVGWFLGCYGNVVVFGVVDVGWRVVFLGFGFIFWVEIDAWLELFTLGRVFL